MIKVVSYLFVCHALKPLRGIIKVENAMERVLLEYFENLVNPGNLCHPFPRERHSPPLWFAFGAEQQWTDVCTCNRDCLTPPPSLHLSPPNPSSQDLLC